MSEKLPVDTKIAELLISKFCHELVGAAGALGNGVEFISENSNKPVEPDVLKLLTKSSGQLTSRLKFYRIAYGFSTHGFESLVDLRSLALGMFSGDDLVSLSWPMAPVVPDLDDGEGRLLLNLIILAVGFLPAGGDIEVIIEDDGLSVVAEGQGCRYSKGYLDVADTDEKNTQLTVQNIHEYYTISYAKRLLKNIQTEKDTDKITFQINNVEN